MRLRPANLLALVFVLVSPFAGAQDAVHACFGAASAKYNIHPALLRAIAQQESSMNPSAFRRNADGSEDIGLMGINTVHLPVLGTAGIGREKLFDPCTNIMVGAWLLATKVARHGMTWKAVGLYHSATPSRRDDYARRVWQRLAMAGAY